MKPSRISLHTPDGFLRGTFIPDASLPNTGALPEGRTKMNEEELNHLAACENAMKLARWAIACQLTRWRDGDSVCAVKELQEALDALLPMVGEAKPYEPDTPRTNAARVLCNYGQEMVPVALARELEHEVNLLRNEIEARDNDDAEEQRMDETHE